ncbi:MAG: hypothetical protein ACOH5I_19430 [Oligoflexus sp.]
MKDMTLKQQGLPSYAVGCVSYWSFLPLVTELRRTPGLLDLRIDHPSHLCSLVEEQDLDLGFCSVTSLATRSDLELALPLGEAIYGSYGPAYISLCESGPDMQKEIEQRLAAVKEVFQQFSIQNGCDSSLSVDALWDALRNLEKSWTRLAPDLKLCGTKASAYTSLGKLIYRILFGEAAWESLDIQGGSSQFSASGASLELRCGNEAMTKRCCHAYTLDLVDTWYNLTHLPFVPHVLLKSQRLHLTQNTKNQILKASELAQAKMHVEPATYLPDLQPVNQHGNIIDLGMIWKHVSYRLNSDCLKSVRLFLQLVRPFEKRRDTDESFRLKMIRWQQREADAVSYLV